MTANHQGHEDHEGRNCLLFRRPIVSIVLLVVGFLAIGLTGCDLDGPWPEQQRQKCWQDRDGNWHCPPRRDCYRDRDGNWHCPPRRDCYRDRDGNWHCPDGDCTPLPTPHSPLPTASEGVPGYADVPDSIEQANWVAPNGSGSCMWAASSTMLRYFGEYELADWWIENHGGGATAEDAAAEARRVGLRPIVCDTGDPAFLDWCDATRRPASIHYPWIIGGGPKCHAVLFVGWRDGCAVLRDDNAPGTESLVPRDHFLDVWRRGWSTSGGGDGRAWTLLADPAIPRPW
jgi:hypothetical protein